MLKCYYLNIFIILICNMPEWLVVIMLLQTNANHCTSFLHFQVLSSLLTRLEGLFHLCKNEGLILSPFLRSQMALFFAPEFEALHLSLTNPGATPDLRNLRMKSKTNQTIVFHTYTNHINGWVYLKFHREAEKHSWTSVFSDLRLFFAPEFAPGFEFAS